MQDTRFIELLSKRRKTPLIYVDGVPYKSLIEACKYENLPYHTICRVKEFPVICKGKIIDKL